MPSMEAAHSLKRAAILNVGNSTVTNGTTFTVGGAGTGVYNMDGGTANFYNALTVGAKRHAES